MDHTMVHFDPKVLLHESFAEHSIDSIPFSEIYTLASNLFQIFLCHITCTERKILTAIKDHVHGQIDRTITDGA